MLSIDRSVPPRAVACIIMRHLVPYFISFLSFNNNYARKNELREKQYNNNTSYFMLKRCAHFYFRIILIQLKLSKILPHSFSIKDEFPFPLQENVSTY